jgi:PPOX class probable F420-dependent enzyme
VSSTVLPDPASPFGERVRHRLREERVVWFTTVGRDGTPQPNPVWFLWDWATSVLIYSRPQARRLDHLRANPRVSLHFDGNGRGGDIVVLTGRAVILGSATPPHRAGAYVGKYRNDMLRVSGTLEAFSSAYPTELRVEVTRIRGH